MTHGELFHTIWFGSLCSFIGGKYREFSFMRRKNKKLFTLCQRWQSFRHGKDETLYHSIALSQETKPVSDWIVVK